MKQVLVPLIFSLPWTVLDAQSGCAEEPLIRFQAKVPRTTADCTASQAGELHQAARAVEQWAADVGWNGPPDDPRRTLNDIRRLIQAKKQADAALDETLSLRTRFAGLPEGQARRDLLRGYLAAMSQLIDLSGRLRALLLDAITRAADRFDPLPTQLAALVDLLTETETSVGAAAMSFVLLDPPPDLGVEPFTPELKRKVLRLIEVTRQADSLPDLAEFLRGKNTPPELVVAGAEVVREIGLPQDPRPGQDPALPPPALTGAELHGILSRLAVEPSNRPLADRRAKLLAWLDQRRHGIVGETFRFGSLEVRPGDWLLMRNPSPYNLFTDLSPGLFTHVGVVGAELCADGVRRFVIVDLPERGERVPATNLDIYLRRTLHYCFLRHDDPSVGRRMGQAAISVVGNETQFDLSFRSDRVLQLKGKPLRGALINTYCAGFLLLCAQESGAPREQFFPIPEHPAGGRLADNLSKLGISIGERFVSPTGALFSPHLRVVGRCEPMYSPGREIAEWIYDRFAQRMINQPLRHSPNALQLARQKLAELSKTSPWLAKALARAHNVSEQVDLESAAKAAAVVETMDAIAEANVNDFAAARNALLAGPSHQLAAQGFTAAQIEQIAQFRQRHQQLFERWTQNRLSPRELDVELVEYYKRQGAPQLDNRLFGGGK